MRKPWQTAAWRERRAEFVKGKSCEWCGSKENLSVHHLDPPLIGLQPYRQIEYCYFNEYFSVEANKEDFEKRMCECKKEYPPYPPWYRDVCPVCQHGSIYERKTMIPKFRCTRCGAEFETPKKVLIERDYEGFIRRRVLFNLRQEHKEEVQALYKEYKEKTREQYIDFETSSLMVLCRKCHFAKEKGKVLCKKCGEHYHSPRFEMCWECFLKTEKGEKWMKERAKLEAEERKWMEEEVPLIEVTLPCLAEVRVYEDQYEYGGILETCLHQCPFPDIGGDVNSCEAFIQYKKEEDEAVEAAFR